MNLRRAFSSERLCKALTGLRIQEFQNLSRSFEMTYLSMEPSKDRQRKPGAGRKGGLPDYQAKLFFILFYFKCYPTYDLASFFWDVHRSRPQKWVSKWKKVVEETLKRELVLPKRKIRNVEEFLQEFPEAKDVFIDATERKIRRPSKKKHKKKQYSGKKKAHTRKNTVMSDGTRRIMAITPTKQGRIHDKKDADKFLFLHHLPQDVTVWLDTGYQGADKIHSNVMMPKKKHKKKPLTQEEKKENHTIASIRCVSEHAIGGIKRYRCLHDTFRNWMKNGWDDDYIFLCAGLWNFHLRYTN